MFSDTGHLLVCDGARPPNQEWVALTNAVALPANSWARITARIDYATQTWDAYLNGTLMAIGLGFAAPQAQPSLLVAQGSEASFDNIYLGHTMPTGIPVSPMWMIENFGHAMVDENNDSDSDGFTNLEENLAGTDPLDPSSKLELLEIESSVSDTYEVTWRSVAGRTYTLQTSTNLVNGFDTILATGIRATPPTNTFNDQIQSVSGKLYKVVLETP